MTTVEIKKASAQVSFITLNRPKKRNALSWALMRDLRAALHEVDSDSNCRVVILNGAGASFCAGLDLVDQGNRDSIRQVVGQLPDGPRLGMRAQEYAAEIVPLLRRIQQPVIAAIHGHASGVSTA